MWLYHRFTLSFRDVEDLLAERGVIVSYEAIRLWCRKFGPAFARNLRRRHGQVGDALHVDEVFITIRGECRYLWRAVDQDRDVLDLPVTRRRDARAAKRFLARSMRPCTTHSGSHAIVSKRSIIDSFGSMHSPLGRPRRVFAERRSTHRYSDQNRFGEIDLLTMPGHLSQAGHRQLRLHFRNLRIPQRDSLT